MRFNACQFSQLNWWMEDKRDYRRHSLFLHMAPCLCQRQICSYIRPLVFVRSRSVLTYGPWSLSEADLFIHMAPCLCQRQICSYIRPLVFVRGRSVPWIQQGVSRLGWHHCMWWPCSPFFVAGAAEMSVSLLVSWCFEPSQPLGVTWGLNTNSNLYLGYSAHKSFHTHTHTHTPTQKQQQLYNIFLLNHNISLSQLKYFFTRSFLQHISIRGRPVPWIQQDVSWLGWHCCTWWLCSPFCVAGPAEMSEQSEQVPGTRQDRHQRCQVGCCKSPPPSPLVRFDSSCWFPARLLHGSKGWFILSRCTCCLVSFPPWRGLYAADNRCWRSYFDTFPFYFTSSWRMVGV